MGAVDQNQDRQGLQQAGHGHHFIMTQRRKHSQKSYRRATFKRSDSTREESKKTKSHLDVLDTMKEKEGLKIALIVLNSQYKGRGYRNLQGVSKDGDLMGRMLEDSFDQIEVSENLSSFHEEIRRFCDDFKDQNIQVLHFHYSGKYFSLFGW